MEEIVFRAVWNGAVPAEGNQQDPRRRHRPRGGAVTAAAGTPGAVRAYWRPGCPFCAMLRLGLRRSGVRAEWVNIWDDPAAAARVRAITGGDETVPTVVVGTRAMVNPSARQVVAAMKAEGIVQAPVARRATWLARAARVRPRRGPRRRPAVDEPGGPAAG